MYDVICNGSATVDAFIETGNKLFKGSDGHVKVPFGSKIRIEHLEFQVGGGGTNSAVALSRLGLKVAFLGKIGLGTNSKRILNLLKKEKVDTSLIQRSNARTGFSVILDAYKHDRIILAFKGSNDDVRFTEIKKNKLKTKWFYFSSMMNESFATQKKLAQFAAKNNIKIIYNPSAYLIKKGLKYLNPVIKHTNILTLNKEEAAMLVGKGSIKALLKKLKKLVKDIAIITDGPNGAYCYDGIHFLRLQAHNIKVKETTGAGDTFTSSFLAALIKTHNIRTALQLGLVNAESIITTIGGKKNLLHWNKAMSRIKRNPAKLYEF